MLRVTEKMKTTLLLNLFKLKKKKMDLISKEMFLNLGIDYNDAGLLFHYLHERKISKKKNFIKIPILIVNFYF